MKLAQWHEVPSSRQIARGDLERSERRTARSAPGQPKAARPVPQSRWPQRGCLLAAMPQLAAEKSVRRVSRLGSARCGERQASFWQRPVWDTTSLRCSRRLTGSLRKLCRAMIRDRIDEYCGHWCCDVDLKATRRCRSARSRAASSSAPVAAAASPAR